MVVSLSALSASAWKLSVPATLAFLNCFIAIQIYFPLDFYSLIGRSISAGWVSDGFVGLGLQNVLPVC